MDDMASGFFKKLTGKVPAFYKGIGTYATLRTTQSKAMFDNDSTTYYTSGNSQNTGDWIGADLGCVRSVSEVRILQGRNSVMMWITSTTPYWSILWTERNGRRSQAS